jgi:hypothetical protein
MREAMWLLRQTAGAGGSADGCIGPLGEVESWLFEVLGLGRSTAEGVGPEAIPRDVFRGVAARQLFCPAKPQAAGC